MTWPSEHDWKRGQVRDGMPSLICTTCGKVWKPDESLRDQGRCAGPCQGCRTDGDGLIASHNRHCIYNPMSENYAF